MRSRDDLYAYQKRGAQFIKETTNCALFVDCGMGKTCTTLTAFADLLDSFDAQRAMIFAPLRVARKVWSDEVREWSHLQGLEVVHVGGTQAQRLKALSTPADIHTIGRENTKWLIDQFISGRKQIRKWPWDTVILDESQSWKSQSSQRWESLRLARQLFPRCIELTGTPAPNGYADLWSQIYLLDRGERLGRSESAFRDRWFDTENYGEYSKYIIKPNAAAEITAVISDIVMSLRAEDYFDLPPMVYNPVWVTLSDKALATYRKFRRTSIYETLAGKKITAVNAGVAYGKLMQLANGAIYTDTTGAYETFHDEKIDALLEALEGITRGQVIIGYGFVSDSDRIAKALDRFCGKTKKWAVMREDADLNRFARGELDIGVMHPASAGHGLNDLHKAGCQDVIWFGLTPNLELFQQLNGRIGGGIRRLGKNVVIHMLLAEDTDDREAMELLTVKAQTQDDLTNSMARKVQ